LFNDGVWGGPPPPPSVPSITVNDVRVTQGNGGTRATGLTVALSAPPDQPVTVQYATADGTATAGSDFQAGSGTLIIPAGQTTGTVTVPVIAEPLIAEPLIGDRLPERNESFVVNLSGATNATVADGQAVGTIVDDEPRISVSDVTSYEGKKGPKTLFTFTATPSAAYDQAVTMSYSTANDPATTGDNDYVAKTGTLTFLPGETTKTITVEVKGDGKREADEYFYLDLSGLGGNALFARERGTGAALNDD
jgi:hypothetical protein